EGGRAGRDGDGMVDRARRRERGLELADLRPHRQLPALEHLGSGRDLVGADVWARQADQRSAGLRSLYHAIVRARPSSSSTFGSKLRSARALSTFGIRSSTSMYPSGVKRMSPLAPVRWWMRRARS